MYGSLLSVSGLARSRISGAVMAMEASENVIKRDFLMTIHCLSSTQFIDSFTYLNQLRAGLSILNLRL